MNFLTTCHLSTLSDKHKSAADLPACIECLDLHQAMPLDLGEPQLCG